MHFDSVTQGWEHTYPALAALVQLTTATVEPTKSQQVALNLRRLLR
jgi:hypothetical protein